MADINPVFGLAVVSAFDPATCEVTLVERTGGTVYKNVVYRPNLHVYATPQITDLRPGSYNTLKTGSLVLFARFSASEIRIICIVEDDSSIVQQKEGAGRKNQQGANTDAFTRMAQDGETMIGAPGEFDPATKNRAQGSWLHCRKDGTLIVSNADTSANVSLAGNGSVFINSTDYTIAGIGSSIRQAEDGSLTLSCDKNGAAGAQLNMTCGSDAQYAPAVSLSVPNAGVALAEGTSTLYGREVAVSAGEKATINAAQTVVKGSTFDVETNGVVTLKCANGATVQVARTGVFITLPNDKNNQPLPLVVNGVDTSLEMGNVLCVAEGATSVTSLDDIKITKHILAPVQ